MVFESDNSKIIEMSAKYGTHAVQYKYTFEKLVKIKNIILCFENLVGRENPVNFFICALFALTNYRLIVVLLF